MQPRKGTFQALLALGEDVVEQVDKMLLGGEVPSKVAKWLQSQGYFKDLREASVKKNLERYRATDLKDKVVNQVIGATVGKTAAVLHRKLLAHDELEKLVAIQWERFTTSMVKETQLKSQGIVLQAARDEARLLREMLESLGKIQLETGIIRRAPKTTTGTLIDPATGEVRQYSWTEQQERLYKQIEGVALEPDEVNPEDIADVG